jgi:hypothetical protein
MPPGLYVPPPPQIKKRVQDLWKLSFTSLYRTSVNYCMTQSYFFKIPGTPGTD